MYFANFHTVLTDFNVVLSVLAVGVVVVLGALNVRNRYITSKDAETIRSLKDSNDAFETQHKADQITLEIKDKENKALTDQNTLLAQKADILEKHVTQAPQINDLAVQLATQHKELMTAFSKQTKELGNIAKAVLKDSNAN